MRHGSTLAASALMMACNLQGLPALMMPSGVRAADPLQVLGMPGASLFRNMAPGDAPVLDAHERNAMIGHTLGAVDALLVALRCADNFLSHHIIPARKTSNRSYVPSLVRTNPLHVSWYSLPLSMELLQVSRYMAYL